MSDEEIKAMQEENARLKEEKATLEKNAEVQAENFRKLREKSAHDYKTLEQLTQDERDEMTEREIAVKRDQDALYAEQQAFRKQQEEVRKAELEVSKKAIIKEFAGENAELAKKIEVNMSKFAGEIITTEDLRTRITEAFILTGEKKVDPILDAHNKQGAQDGITFDPTKGISETQKAMVENMPGIAALLADDNK